MANRHFGRIGDVWKHLPLLEVLSLERPKQYWESHAGSASYPLTHSPDRDYGVYWFLDHAGGDSLLAASRYLESLRGLPRSGHYPHIYPGSAELAMIQLGVNAERYVFCDLDSKSVQSLQSSAEEKSLAARVEVIHGDGMDTIWDQAQGLGPQQRGEVVIHIDPFDPFESSPARGLSAIDLARELSALGCKVIYWYGLDSVSDSSWAFNEILEHSSGPVWCGEVSVDPAGSPMLLEGILLGCGIVGTNLSSEAIDTLIGLGRALEAIYREARLPLGGPGGLRFREVKA